MVHEDEPGEGSLTEAPSSSAPTTGRGKPRLSGSLPQLIMQSFEGSRKILSLLDIQESLAGVGYPVNKNSRRLKRELHGLVSHGVLIRVSGSGASASFRFNSSRARGASARADPGKKKVAAPKKAAVGKKPRKKAGKKQPPKGPQRKSAVQPRKKHSTRAAAAKKANRKRN